MSEQPTMANPYTAPVAEWEKEAPVDDGRRHGTWAWILFGAAIGASALSVVLMAFLEAPKLGTLWFVLATIAAFAGLASGILGLVRAARARAATSGFTVVVLLAVLGNGFMTLAGALMALVATAGFSRGRQLRRAGRVLLPPVRAGRAWADLSLEVSVPESERRALAAQWRENGRTEHASVAAFARLTLDLMALGAPPDLVAASNRDSLDEIRHTELCFSLARALDGRDESPGAFPEAQRARTLPSSSRALALATLAVDSLVDGALHEGISARVIARLAKRCEEQQIRAVLKEIAADEGRHAAHGWDVVQWCLAEGGAPVADALRGAIAALPRTMRTPLPAPAEDGGWERFGIHGRALEAEELASTRADLVRRVEAMIGPARAAA